MDPYLNPGIERNARRGIRIHGRGFQNNFGGGNIENYLILLRQSE